MKSLAKIGSVTLLVALSLTACSASQTSSRPDSSPAADRSVTSAGTSTGTSTGTSAPGTATRTSPAPVSASASASTTGSTSASPAAHRPAKQVHVSLYNADGATYGVGMPVIAYFSRTITNARALQQATKVTANGKPLAAAWYFENSTAPDNGPIEGHLRPESYWPAHAKIHVALPVAGLSAGKHLAYDDSLTLDFKTGARVIATVSDAKHRLTLDVDGKRVGRFPVSLGGPGSRTINGTKVVMEQAQDTRMKGAHGGIEYDLAHVYWTQRLTYSGEYLHAAPWNDPANGGVIGRGDSSNGCTNLTTADARTLFKDMEVGDVVRYPDAQGPKMRLGDGFGDWNLSWSQWLTGGLVPTS